MIKKIINIFGNNGSGKSIVSILLANILATNNLNVLIIDSNYKDIFKIFNKKINNKIIKIQNFYITNKYIKNEIEKFEIIILDNPNIKFLKTKDLLKNSTNIFLSESNLLGIKKLIILINKYTKEINKEKINIIFNKYNSNSIDYQILIKILKDFKILGKINYSKKIETLINTGKIIKINSIKKDLLKIIEKIIKENRKYGNRIKEPVK